MSQNGLSDPLSDQPWRGVTSDQVAAIAMDRRAHASEWPRVVPLNTAAEQAEEYLPKAYDVYVSRYFQFGSTIVICGDAGLREFLPRLQRLEHLMITCSILGGPEPVAQRYIGALEACFVRRDKTWSDLGNGPAGRRFVIGMDFHRARLYAFREDEHARRSEICFAEIPANSGSPFRWQRLCGLPEGGTCFLDASHFIQSERGPCAVIRLRDTHGLSVHRFLSIEERAVSQEILPVANWGDSMSEHYSIIRSDYRPKLGDLRHRGQPSGLLLGHRIPGGYRIERLYFPKKEEDRRFIPSSACAYFVLQKQAQQGGLLIPPVLQP